MPALRIYFDGDRTGPLFRRSTLRQGDRVRAAARGTARDVVAEVEIKSRQDIQSAGRFRSSMWFPQGRVSEGGGSIRIEFSVGTGLFWVFQRGMVIQGKPLLWIPLSFAADAQGVWARDYPEPLFRVDRAGKAPLLMAAVAGGQAEAKYFGKEQVVEPKKFHVVEIIRAAARGMKNYYRARMK
jgi:hypothetical protein